MKPLGIRFRLLLATLLVLPLAAGATARPGGWGIVTVHDLPDYVVAGETVELTFTARGHGVTRMTGLTGAIRTVGAGGEVSAAIRPSAAPGDYTASLVAPEEGELTLAISGTPSGMGAYDFLNTRLLPIPVVAAGDGPAPPPSTLRERGERLFVAKGCARCHSHDAVVARGYTAVPGFPVLSGRRFPEAFLARLLADPASVPGPDGRQRRMPDLELDRAEIDALIAFLNGVESQRVTAGG